MFFVILLIIIGANNLLVNANAKEVHAFFYLWYGNPESDGSYKHWDHAILNHWEQRINDMYPSIGTRFVPPDNVHSPYYPLRGVYSSKDSSTLQEQFDDCNRAGIKVIVLSWWGKKTESYATDTQGVNTDAILHNIFKAADKDKNKIKLTLHLEPYPSRSAESVKSDVAYIIENYGNYSSFYRYENKPLFYVYDSYHIFPYSWANILTPQGTDSLRNTNIDAIFLGLWLDSQHGRDLLESGFDGIYTYFSSNSFSYGSTLSNFKTISKFCKKNNLIVNLSIGPGYNDTKIRPWNIANTKERNAGKYYKNAWEKAIDADSDMISITSFNEWGEGSQIEPAIKKLGYSDYGDDGSYKYIDLTKQYVDKFTRENEL